MENMGESIPKLSCKFCLLLKEYYYVEVPTYYLGSKKVEMEFSQHFCCKTEQNVLF